MPNPVALLQVSLASASPVTGVVATTTGTSVQPSGISTVGWTQQKFEIYDYPVGFSCPSGWSTDSVGVYFYSLSASPPPFTPSVWGKYMLRLTANNGLNGNGQNDPTLVDVTCLLDIPSPTLAFHDIGFGETNQVSKLKQWLGAYQGNLRIIDATIGSGVALGLASTFPAPVGTTAVIGTSLTAARADHVHALPFTPVLNALGAASSSVGLNGQALISVSSLSTDIAANVATTGALRLPVTDATIIAHKGGSHATVPLFSTGGGGSQIVLGDGLEIVSVSFLSAYLSQMGPASFASGSSATIGQGQLGGTGATAGFAMTIQAQQGQAVAAGPNNNGGLLTLAGGAVGGGGTGGVQGNVALQGGGVTVTVSPTGTDFGAGSLADIGASVAFNNAVTPSLVQAAIAGTGSSAGATMTVQPQAGQAQTLANANTTGGALHLYGGAAGTGGSGAAGAQGAVVLQGGGVTATLGAAGLDLPAAMTFDPVTAPAAPASGWRVYVDSADGRLKAISPTGAVVYLSRSMQQNNSKTLVANNTTAHVPVWQVTGTVKITRCYAIVTTTIGANHTASGFRLNDQTAQPTMSIATVGNLNGAPVGSFVGLIYNGGTAENDCVCTSAATGVVGTPQGGARLLAEFQLTQKHGVVMGGVIEYSYTTTDAPTSGVLQFFLEYEPLSADGAVTAL